MLHLEFLNSPNYSQYQALVSSQNYVVCSFKHNGNVEFWTIHSSLEKPVLLYGHHRTVTALTLAHQPRGYYLCSCSSDNAILWNLLDNDGYPQRGKVLLSNIKLPSCACFSADNSQIIICCESEILVYNLSTSSCSSIDSLTCIVNDCKLLSNSILATIDDDCYLRGWSFEKFEIVNQKLVSPGFPCAIAIHQATNHIVIATSTGHLSMFGNNYILIRNFRIGSLVKASFDKNIVNIENHRDALEDFDDIDCNIVLCLRILCITNNKDPTEKLSPDTFYAIVVTTSCLLVFNLNVEECAYFLNFMEPALIDEVERTLGLIRLASIAEASEELNAYITLIPAFGKAIISLKLLLNDVCNKIDSEIHESRILSFLSSGAISDSSYLKLKSNVEKPVKEKKISSLTNNPLTFHSKIKSSGYGSQHRPAMFQLPKSKSCIPKSSKSEFSSAVQRAIENRTLFQNRRPELLSECCINNTTALVSAKLSISGKHVLCAANDGTVDVLKTENGCCNVVNSVSCHKGAVNSINWSHSGKLFLTSGSDRTAKLWSLSSRNQIPLLYVGSSQNDKERKFAASLLKDRNVFEDSIAEVLFYYLDQFILLSCKNNLFMYSYFIKDHKTELKRFNNLSYCKLRVKVPVDCQRITALAAVNQFFSNLVLCSGTSKCLDVLDMNTTQVVWHADDISCKPPYLISINEGSVNSQQTTSMYDSFLTASLTDGIKLWDLRTKSSVIKYREHTSTTFPCGLSFSACGRYIATGSEDKAMYIYDLRSTSSLYKLSDPPDIVTAALFHPSGSQMHIYNLRSTSSLYKLSDPPDIVTAALFHPSGSQILGATLNGMMYVYG